MEAPSDGPRSLPAERYYARLAQRLLSYLTVMTSSGRLYPVDTRLRPNGRAGSLVSSLDAFADYQLTEAWTWELQALTRARFVAGNETTGKRFTRIRKEALQRPRDPEFLRAELAGMRQRIAQEHAGPEGAEPAPKHQPGGLVDIEFAVQLGVLANAVTHPAVMENTATLALLRSLADAHWLGNEEARILEQTSRALQQQRMLETLVPGEHRQRIDTTAAALIVRNLLGSEGPAPPP
jgi:glutamate-ammonia-ligase adenylyltransferase